MKITVLIENTLSKTEMVNRLKCEHGLSLLIDYNGEQYLLDAGSSGAFIENADNLGIHMDTIKTCVLSHAHYDHADGFATFFQQNNNAKVYTMSQSVNSYYSTSGGSMHYIGIKDGMLAEHQEQFCFIETQTEIAPGVFLIPHNTRGLFIIGDRAGLYKKENDSYIPDDFSHELSLVFDTDKGLVICNSCSHGGIVNIINEVKDALPNKNIYAFVGGLHMMKKKDGKEICTFTEQEVQQMSEYLLLCGVCKVYTGHCTGALGAELLRTYMGERVEQLATGKTIVL